LGESEGSEKEEDGQKGQNLVLHEDLLLILGDVSDGRLQNARLSDLTSLTWADISLGMG
jgi:hypothetical protein